MWNQGHPPAGLFTAGIMPSVKISPATIETFLGLFASTPEALAAELAACPKPWQTLPIQNRPLLRLDDTVVVLDEQYLIERVTRGLSWLVHDHERDHVSDTARVRWTTAYGEMVETRAEDQLWPMAPRLIGGTRAFFAEDDLQAAFPRSRSATRELTTAVTSSWPRSSRVRSRCPPGRTPT